MRYKDIYYNYLNDVYSEFEIDKLCNEIDSKSAKLNHSLYHLYFMNKEKNRSYGLYNIDIVYQNFKCGPFYSYFIYHFDGHSNKKNDYILSVDYIGPSVYQCRQIANLKPNDIKEILKISRTLGGHLVWPRGNNKSVNTLKGGKLKAGCNYGFYDRIDWVLLLLKIFYLTIHKDRHDYIQQIKKHFNVSAFDSEDLECFNEMYDAFNIEKNYYLGFKTFENYCDFYKLTNSFVDSSYNVVELTRYFPIKPSKENYIEYIKNNIIAINSRNKVIEQQ